jgi:hypothetical protein
MLLGTHSTPSHFSHLTGMEMGFHIMGNSENIGSNIIFSSALWHGKKATRRRKWGRRRREGGEKKLPSALNRGALRGKLVEWKYNTKPPSTERE